MKIERCGDCEHIKLLPSSGLFGGQWVCGKTGQPVNPGRFIVCELKYQTYATSEAK